MTVDCLYKVFETIDIIGPWLYYCLYEEMSRDGMTRQ